MSARNKKIGFFGRSATFGRKLKCLDPIFLTETGKNFANRVVAKILTYPRRKKVSEAKIGSFQIVLNFFCFKMADHNWFVNFLDKFFLLSGKCRRLDFGRFAGELGKLEAVS